MLSGTGHSDYGKELSGSQCLECLTVPDPDVTENVWGVQADTFPYFGEEHESTVSLWEREALGFKILAAVGC